MEEEEDLDKETVGRKVSTSNIGPIYKIQNFYVVIIYISAILTLCNEMPKLLVLIQNSSPMKSQIPNIHTYSHCAAAKTSIFDDHVQVAEKLPAEILKEYREIFSFFDRFSFTWPRLCASVIMRSLIICSATTRPLKNCFQSETAVAPSEQRSLHRWAFCLLDSGWDC